MDAFIDTEHVLRFGAFELDVRSRELRTGTKSVRLQEQPFEILRMMLERPGHVVTRDELRDRLWPGGTFVDFEHSLNAAVKRLRAALGDDAHRPVYIRTVYAYGYAFIADAVEHTAAPLDPASDGPHRPPSAWRLIHEHREIPLAEGANVLGRSGAGVIVLESPTISRHHAKLSIEGDRATLEDLGSKNGTWIGTVPVTAGVPVQDGDELRLGSVVMVSMRPRLS